MGICYLEFKMKGTCFLSHIVPNNNVNREEEHECDIATNITWINVTYI